MTTIGRYQMKISNLDNLKKDLQQILSHADSAHDYNHALCVAEHVKKAYYGPKLKFYVAALLHDAEDKSLKGQNNIVPLLEKYFPEFKEDILLMIKITSFSENGNIVDPNIPSNFYLVRHADRLESIGLIGIWRCYQYTLYKGQPFFTEDTPIYKDRDSLDAGIVGVNKVYMKNKISKSFIDHFYEKLLHVKVVTGNNYIDIEMERRHDVMVNFVLDFGRSDNKTKYIEDFVKKI